MTLLQYGKALFGKAFSVGDAYDEGTLNNSFIEEVVESIGHSLRQYRATHLRVGLTNLTFQAQSPLAIQGGSTKRNQTPAILNR